MLRAVKQERAQRGEKVGDKDTASISEGGEEEKCRRTAYVMLKTTTLMASPF